MLVFPPQVLSVLGAVVGSRSPQGVDLAIPRLDLLQDRLEPQRQILRPLSQRPLLPAARFRRVLHRPQPVLGCGVAKKEKWNAGKVALSTSSVCLAITCSSDWPNSSACCCSLDACSSLRRRS